MAREGNAPQIESPVHLIGCGGSGVSALGHLLLDLGYAVSGHDRREGDAIAALRARGARISLGDHRADTVPSDARTVVVSNAIPANSPDLEAARARGLPIVRYTEALGALMRPRVGVAIAGTHGKSTTTGMIATALTLSGRDPSYVVGAEIPQLLRPGHGGRGSEFVVEACEYQRSFLALEYRIAGILNIEAEHLDCFRDLDEIVAAFRAFAQRVPRDGALVLSRSVSDQLGDVTGMRRVRVGFESDLEIHARDLRSVDGCGVFRIGGELTTDEIQLQVPGHHFVEDAVLAAGVLHVLGLPAAEITRGLSEYRGAKRRLEVIAEGTITALSDYAHHPTELAAVEKALRARYPGRRLLAVFQPHQASRLRIFRDEFATVLARFDRAYLADVYQARDTEEDIRLASVADLALAIQANSGSAVACGAAKATIERLFSEWRAGDVAVLLGAGDIDDLRHEVALAVSSAHRR